MKKTFVKIFWIALSITAVSSGCRSYRPEPIDWEEEAKHTQTNEIRITTLEQAATIALIGNRELNTVRLKAANSSKIAKAAGWWDDPELDFDVMRIVNPSDNPFLCGASLAFTIPLSGALALDRKAAAAYSEADFAEISALECDIAAEAKKAAIRLDTLNRRLMMLQSWNLDERAENARRNVKRLHDAGEVSASDYAGMKRRVHTLRHDIMETEKEIGTARIAFLRLAGLRPSMRIAIALADTHEASKPDKNDDPLDLTKHPKVSAALARLKGSEHQLHSEIRKQYPDLKLGPAYSNEEGLDRFGLIAGLTLPIWNRNRKGIAHAEGERDEKRLSAINTWFSLVCDAAEARANLIRLLEHPPAPASEREEADKLADAGELTPLEYLNVREEIVGFELAHAAWKGNVLLALSELEKFNIKRQ